MTITPRNYRFSYLYIFLTLILFSASFTSHENALLITIFFLFIVNLTCFSNEYLVIKYYQKNKQKKPNNGYALFIMIQTIFTVLLFAVVKFYV